MNFIRRLFNQEAPFWQFMSKLADSLILHFFWVVCSLPVITFGASTIALYYATMKNVSDEDNEYVKAFFCSFKQNFKQGIPMGLIFLLGSVLMLFGIQAYYSVENPDPTITIFGFLQILLFVLFVFSFEYAFPMMARFENTVIQTIKNGFMMSIHHLGRTLLMTLVLAAVYLVAFALGFWPILIFGFGLVVLLQSYSLNRIMKPYLEKALEEHGKSEESQNIE